MGRSASAELSSGATPSARELARQALWNYAALVLQLGGSVVLIAMAFRRLPAADVGVFALTAVTVGLVQILDPAAGYVISRVVAGRDEADALTVAQIRAGLLTVAVALAGAVGLAEVILLAVGVHGLGPGRLAMIACVVLATCVQLGSAALPATAQAVGQYRELCESSALTTAVTLGVAWLLFRPAGVAALGIALLAGQIAGRAWLFARTRGIATDHEPAVPALATLRPLWQHSGAIYVSSLAAQLLAVSDLWTVGAFRGAGSTAAYRAGSMIPTQASSLFYRLYDVLYPRLPRMRDSSTQERAVALVSRVFGAAAGCLFAALFLERGPFTRLLLGRTDVLAEHVFAVFCAIWLVNIPIHGVVLLLISRGQNRVLTPVVLVEAAVNIVVSVVLVVWVGPIGAAVGTLATMAVSNLVVMPWLVERLVPGTVRLVWVGTGCCLLGVGVSAALQGPAALGLSGMAGSASVVAAGAVSVVAAVWLAAGRQGRQVIRAHV